MLLHYFKEFHCPHCNTISSQSILHAASEKKKDSSIGWISDELIRAFIECHNCNQPSMLVLRPKKFSHGSINYQDVPILGNTDHHIQFLNRLRSLIDILDLKKPPHDQQRGLQRNWIINSTQHEGIILNNFYDIVQQFPDSQIQKPNEKYIPPALMGEINDLISVLGQPRFAIIGCRRVIERACKEKLGPKAEKMKLHQLIEASLTDLEATKQINQWAHTLRNLGNEAVHGDDSSPTLDEAQQAFDLTMLLLDLLFTYPKRIENLRST